MVRLFGRLPGTLRVVWAILVIGLIMLITGYFTRIAWQSFVGLGCLISGYGIGLLDGFLRKKRRDDAATFHVGAIISPIVSVFLLFLIALIGGVVLLIQSWVHGYSSARSLRLLHFLGILYALLVVTGIASFASKDWSDTEAENKTEQEDTEIDNSPDS